MKVLKEFRGGEGGGGYGRRINEVLESHTMMETNSCGCKVENVE